MRPQLKAGVLVELEEHPDRREGPGPDLLRDDTAPHGHKEEITTLLAVCACGLFAVLFTAALTLVVLWAAGSHGVLADLSNV